MSRPSLEGKVAVVTGGSSGIGRAISLRFADEGAHVIVSSRQLARCQDVVDEIRERGGSAIAIEGDVRDERSMDSLFETSKSTFGRLDIAVASAGISGGNKTVDEYSLEEWNRVVETNLTGVFVTVREAFRRMKPTGGHILIISSQAGIEGYARKAAYCATKFGVRGLAHVLGEEGRAYDINVSALCPGTVDTPILRATDTNVGHPLDQDAVADAAVFLVSLRGNSMIRDMVLERVNRD